MRHLKKDRQRVNERERYREGGGDEDRVRQIYNSQTNIQTDRSKHR